MARLTKRSRSRIKGSNVALPGRRYPIHDRAHARSALGFVAMHGTAGEKARVRAAVRRKYGMGRKRTSRRRKRR